MNALRKALCSLPNLVNYKNGLFHSFKPYRGGQVNRGVVLELANIGARTIQRWHLLPGDVFIYRGDLSMTVPEFFQIGPGGPEVLPPGDSQPRRYDVPGTGLRFQGYSNNPGSDSLVILLGWLNQQPVRLVDPRKHAAACAALFSFQNLQKRE